MALTKIPRGLLDTGIADSSDATAITIDSSENVTFAGNILKTGSLTVDVSGTLILDSDDGDLQLKDGGTQFASLYKSSNDFIVRSMISDGDFKIQGNDGGSTINALTIDMSDAGAATFNNTVTIPKLLTLNNPASVQAKFNPNNNSFAAVAEFYNGTSSSNPFIVGQGYATGTDNISYVWNRANADLLFGTNNTEKMRITNSTHNHVVIGSFSVTDITAQWATGAVLDIHDSGSSNTGSVILSNDLTTNDGGIGNLVWANRNNSNASGATNTVISAISASLATSDSNSGDDSGGYLRFFTKPEAGSLTQRLTISTNGWTEVNTTDQTSYPFRANNNHASFNGWAYGTDCGRAASTDYYMFVGRSNTNSSSDNEFLMRGDGNGYCDGAWNGGGADYAEYFEWKDGNSDGEDRRGYPVVLDGNMIRKATSDDSASSIIGIVSTAPAIVGDSDTEQYKQKYLKDDFGSFIWEDYTVTEWDEINFEGVAGPDRKTTSYHTDQIPSDVTPPSEDVKNEDGQVVKTKAVVTSTDADGNNLRRRKLNPDYDSSKTYETRESRKEWETIGLMGKLRMRKGQPTGDRWIKMRDITDSIEEWLVR